MRKTKKIAIAATLIIIVVLMALVIYKIRTYPLRGNYVVVDYRDEKIVFFQASDIEFRKYPNFLNAFSIIGDYKKQPYKAEKKWKFIQYSDLNLEERGTLNKCTKFDEMVSLSKLEYGVTPICFEETIKATKIEKGIKYYIDYGYVPKKGNYERVYFIIDYCKDKKDNMCLFTNSPIDRILWLKKPEICK